jgi:hypothetical protein
MFITKRHIPRRTFLRGAGVSLALPLLDSMVPAATLLAQTAAAPKARFVATFIPHGAAPGYHLPTGVTLPASAPASGSLTEMPFIYKTLEPWANQTVLLNGLHCRSAEPLPGQSPADHWVASAYLSGNKPKRTAGADVWNGTTIDQIIAQKIGQDTLMPSMQLAVEDPGANSSNCGEGYSCAYTNSISWSTPSTPLPMELNPQVTFERMFGDGSTAEERAAHREQDRSILDSLTGSLSRLRTNISASDRARLDEYAQDVREIERRLQIARKAATDAPAESTVPVGVPESFDEHIKLQFDLLALAFRGDITRVATLLYARDLTSRNYPDSGVLVSFHGGSHHGEDPKRITEYSKMNQYHVKMLAHFIEKLAKTPDGDGTLLDHSLVMYGTNMGNSNQHRHEDVPFVLVGGANGQLKGGRHLVYPTKQIPSGNLLLSVLDRFGIHEEKFGDSTGRLEEL